MFTLPNRDHTTSDRSLEGRAESAPPKKLRKLVAYAESDEEENEDGNVEYSSNWTAIYSSFYSRHYYYNAETKQSQWTAPKGVDDADAIFNTVSLGDDGGTGDAGVADYIAPYRSVEKTVTVGGCISTDEVRRCVSSCGQIEKIYISSFGKPDEWCVRFENEASATAALFLNGRAIEGGSMNQHIELEVRRTMQRNMKRLEEPTKIALRGLPLDVTDDEILEFLNLSTQPLRSSPTTLSLSSSSSSSSSPPSQQQLQSMIRRIYPRQRRPTHHKVGDSEVGIVREEGGAGGGGGDYDESQESHKAWGGLAIVELGAGNADVAAALVATHNGRLLQSRRAAAEGRPGTLVDVEISRRHVWEGVSTWEKATSQQSSSSSSSRLRNAGDTNGELKGTTVWIGGLPAQVDEAVAKDVFAACGPLASFRFVRDKYDGDCRGFGFATYRTPEGAEAALLLNGKSRLGAQPLRVRVSIDKSH